MSILRFGPSVTQTVNVPPATNYSFFPCTEWMPSSAVDVMRVVIGAQAITPSGQTFSMMGALQYAAVTPEQPSAWATVIGSTPLGGSGFQSLTATVAPSSGFWVRFGIGVRNTSTTGTPNTLTLQTSFTSNIKSYGKSIGRKSLTLVSYNSGTQYVPITGWQPALGISKLRGAMVFSGRMLDGGNAIQVAMCWRTADDVNEPSAWTAAGSLRTVAALNELWDTGEQTVTAAGNAFQVGLQFGTVGGGKSQVDVDVLLAGKWA